MGDEVIWLRQPAFHPRRHSRMHLCRLIDVETRAVLAVTGASTLNRAISDAISRQGALPATVIEVYAAGVWQPWPTGGVVRMLRPVTMGGSEA